MQPVLWQPSVELSESEEHIVKRIRRAKLFVFLRHHRDEFSAEIPLSLLLLFTLLPAGRATKPLRGFDMTAMEVPMELISSRDVRTCDIEHVAGFVKWLEGTVCHRRDNVGVPSRDGSIDLVKILLCSGRENPTHFLAHFLHFISAELATTQFTTGTWSSDTPEVVGANVHVPINFGRATLAAYWVLIWARS